MRARSVSHKAYYPVLRGTRYPVTRYWPGTRRFCACYSQRRGCGGGWVCSAHALWPVVAFASTVTATVGTEFAIASSDVLRGLPANASSF